MSVVIEICVKYPGGPTRIKATDIHPPCLPKGAPSDPSVSSFSHGVSMHPPLWHSARRGVHMPAARRGVRPSAARRGPPSAVRRSRHAVLRMYILT
jgi:hypothetical protein